MLDTPSVQQRPTTPVVAQPLLGASPWRGELGSILSHATTGPFIWNRNHLGPRLQDARKGLGEDFLLRLPFPWAGQGTAGIHNPSHIERRAVSAGSSPDGLVKRAEAWGAECRAREQLCVHTGA